jgi:hypothetical protein
MEFQIEKGVPLPPLAVVSGRPTKYPWTEMAVGDSFFVPGQSSVKFSGNITSAKKMTGFKFTTRTVDGGVRVWRTA